jgi:hypothetical protein
MRQSFVTRPFLLRSEQVRDSLIAVIRNLPIDADKPLEIVVREQVKARKLSQQALLFAGPMTDIAQQAWFNGRQFSVEVLHEFCKREFLPEAFDPELCKEGYQKWDVDPLGERVLVGSTTMLTVKGYRIYLEQIFSFGASQGVQFTTKGG